jgi:hypothetical protein
VADPCGSRLRPVSAWALPNSYLPLQHSSCQASRWTGALRLAWQVLALPRSSQPLQHSPWQALRWTGVHRAEMLVQVLPTSSQLLQHSP